MSESCRFRTVPLLVVCIAILSGVARGGDLYHSYTRDFRDQDVDTNTLSLFGVDGRTTKSGFVIEMAAGQNGDVAGFKSGLRLRGDFEISVGYEIREWSLSQQDSSVGPAIYLFAKPAGRPLAPESRAVAELSRICRADGRHVFKAYAAIPNDDGRAKHVRRFAADTLRGRLRLRRQDKTLYFDVSDSPHDDSYRTLTELEFVSEDVRMCRVAVSRSDPLVSADIAITDLSATANEILPSEHTRRRQSVSLCWGIARAFLVSGVVVMWLAQRRRC